MPPDQLKQCAEYIAAFKADVGEKRYFQLSLNRSDPSVDGHTQIDNMGKTFAAAYHTTLRPLLAKAELCRVCRIEGAFRADEVSIMDESARERQRKRREDWLAAFTRSVRGTLEVNLAATGVLDDVDFWWWLFGGFAHRAFPLILVPASRIDPASDFASLLDPTAFGDLGSSQRSSFQAAKRATASGERVAFLPGRSGYRISLGVVAASPATEQLFEAAIEHGGLTPEYIQTYATYDVRPIELGGYGVWIRLNSNQNDWNIIVDALQRAERLGDDDVSALTEGLVAAELVASLFGKPPTNFSRHEPRRAAALTEWAARWAARRPLGEDTRALALRVVRQTTQSILPQRLWRTEGPRLLWYAMLADLESRLT